MSRPLSPPALELVPPTGTDTRVHTAVVVARDPRGLRVRTAAQGERLAHNAVPGGWDPAPGDRVVLLSDGVDCFVVGVLSALRTVGPELPLRVARDETGATHIEVPGDLHLSAPAGRVHLEGRHGVTLESPEDVELRSERALTLESHDGEVARSRLRLEGDAAELRAGVFAAKAARLVALAENVSAVASRLDAQVDEVQTKARRIETQVGTLLERAKESYREVEGLADTRVGRMRLVARGPLSWLAERAKLKAKEAFAIDGETIHLG